MDVMDGLHPEIGKSKRFAFGERGENLRIEMPGRVERRPAGPDDMPGMDDRCRETVPARFVDQERLDRCLLHPVFAERPPRLHFGGGHLDAWAMHPDRSAGKEMLHVPMQGLDQLPCAVRREADHVDHDVRFQRADLFREGA